LELAGIRVETNHVLNPQLIMLQNQQGVKLLIALVLVVLAEQVNGSLQLRFFVIH